MKPLTRLNKELKEVKELLSDIDERIKKGWNLYLGDSIFKYRRGVEKEIIRIEKEIKIINHIENNIL